MLTEPMAVAIAEDNVLLREGLTRILSAAGMEVAGAFDNADELLRLVADRLPDIAILDIRLPPTHSDEGIRAALHIRHAHPGVPVLILSQYAEPGLAMNLLAESADGVGYLLKDRISDVTEFVNSVQRVAAGGSAIDPQIVTTLLQRRRTDDRLSRLTPREHDVLELLAAGASNAGIAEALVVTVGAVEKYVSNIFDKLDLVTTGTESRRVLAVLLYLRH